MPTGQALAERAVERTLERADKIYGHSPKALKAMLADADKTLAIRLAAIQQKHGGPTGKFTEENARLTRQQVQLVQQYTDQRLLGLTHAQARQAVEVSAKSTVALAKSLETHFTGISKPLNLEQAAVIDPLISGTSSSLLSRHKSSVGRYGHAMIADFERVIRTGFVEGMTNHQVIQRMVSTGAVAGITALSLSQSEPAHFPKPTGYMRKQYWAERIVRTETAYAYNRANLQTIQAAQQSDFPDMQKKILATFDKRTAPDSIAVHGQIRNLDQNFRDGAGREYMHPPARPNDRETVVPWRPAWQELPNTVPAPPADAAKAELEAMPGTKPDGKQKWMAMKSAIETKKGQILAQQQAAAQQAEQLKLQVLAAQQAAKDGAGLTGQAEAADLNQKAISEQLAAAKEAAKAKALQEMQEKLEKSKAYQIAIANKAKKEAMEQAEKIAEEKAKQLKKSADFFHAVASGADPEEWMTVWKKTVKQEFPGFLEAYRIQFGSVPASLKQGKNLKMWMVKYGQAKNPDEDFSEYLPKKKIKPVPVPAAPVAAPVVVKVGPAHMQDLPSASGITFKEMPGGPGGMTWMDMHMGNAKVGLFYKDSTGKFLVKPPPGLEKFPAETFSTPEAAAPYALKISQEYQKLKGAKTATDKAMVDAAEVGRHETLLKQRQRFESTEKNPTLAELPVQKLAVSERGPIDNKPMTMDGRPITGYAAIQEAAGKAMGKESAAKVHYFTSNIGFRNVRSSEVKFSVGHIGDVRKKSDYKLKPLGKRNESSRAIAAGLESAKGVATKDQLLWRGISGVHPDLVDDWLRTGTFDNIGTASATRDKSVAKRFANIEEKRTGEMTGGNQYTGRLSILFRVKNKTAVPIETMSSFGSEYEVLIPAGVEYKITNAYKATGSDGMVVIIEGEEL